jgi:hypothetical protein
MKALERQIRGVICEVELPEGAILEAGEMRQDMGQLEGRAHQNAFPNPKQGSTKERAKVEWIIKAPNGGVLKLVVRHDRAGVIRAEVELKKRDTESRGA